MQEKRSCPTDREYRRFETERLRERIAVLEDDRSRLMAYSRSPRHGRYDESFLSDKLRLELAHTPSGVLLETVEVEARCLRRCLAELKDGALSSPSDATAQALRQWQAIDRRLRHGEFESLDAALDVAFAAGLVRRSLGASSSVETLCVIEPARDENLVPGPVLLIGFEGGSYGGPRLYRPISDELRPDTGAFG